MLNEEWYGHTNGGLNWFSPDYDVVYQAYERENPGMSFGCTSQYGIIYDGKLIVSSKQAVDGGDPLPFSNPEPSAALTVRLHSPSRWPESS